MAFNLRTSGIPAVENVLTRAQPGILPVFGAPETLAQLRDRVQDLWNATSLLINTESATDYRYPERLLWETMEALNIFRMTHGISLPDDPEVGHLHADYSQEGVPLRPLVWDGEDWVNYSPDIQPGGVMIDVILAPFLVNQGVVNAPNQALVNALRTELRAGAPAGRDTFAEISALIDTLQAAIAAGSFANAALTGVPTAPTAAPGTNTTQIATTAFVKAATDAIPASNITGVLDPARIPPSVRAMPQVSSGGITALTTEQQAAIGEGSPVLLTDGRVLYYKGTGSKTSEASYVIGADQTPAEPQIPALPMSRITGLEAALAAKMQLLSGVAGVIDPGTGIARVIAVTDLPMISFLGAVFPESHGALGGEADDTAALQAALNALRDSPVSCKLILSTFYKTGPLTYAPNTLGRSIAIEGINSMEAGLRYVGTAGGHCLHHTFGAAASGVVNHFRLAQLTIKTAVVSAGDAVKVSRTASASVAPNSVYEDVYIRHEGSGYFANGFHTIDASDQWFNRCYIMMFGNQSNACVFIDNNLTTQSVYGCYFLNCSMNGAQYNIRATGQLESLYMTDGSYVGATDPVSLDATGTTFGNPHLSIKGSHINGKRRAVHTKKWRAIQIVGTDIYSGVGTDDVDGPNLFIEDAEHVTIGLNKFEIGAVARARSFLDFLNVDNFTIVGNVMHNATAAGMVIRGSSERGIIGLNTVEAYDDGTPSNEGFYIVTTGGDIDVALNQVRGFAKGAFVAASEVSFKMNRWRNLATGIEVSSGSNVESISDRFRNVTTEYAGPIQRELSRTFTLNPANVGAGSRHTEVVEVLGVKFGDTVLVAAPYDLNDLQVTAAVINDNYIGVYFDNDTTTARDFAAGTYRVRFSNL